MHTIFFVLPRTAARLQTVLDLQAGKNCPERYLFYGMDYCIRQELLVETNLLCSGRFNNIKFYFGWLFNRCISHLGGYGGEFDDILYNSNLHRKSEVIVVFTGRLAFPLIYLRLLGLLPNRRTIMITNGLPDKLAHFRNRFLLSKVLKSLREFEVVISLSLPEQERLINKYRLRNTVFIPEAVDTDYYNPKMLSVSQQIDVISIGSDKYRDFHTIISAARELPMVKIVIITTEAHRKAMPADIPQNVKILIDQPMRKMKEYIASAKITCVLVKENIYSGGTTVVLQAMSLGCPVITNEIGSNIDRSFFKHGHNIWFVKPGDKDEVIRTIKDLLHNEALRKHLGKNARKDTVKKRNLELFHKKIYEHIERALYQ